MKDINNVIKAIIAHQQAVVGPLAVEQANEVTGLTVSNTGSLSVKLKKGDTSKVLGQLVKKYERLFGRASVEVCRDAVKEVGSGIPPKDLPKILR